jgi:hypothetical protein
MKKLVCFLVLALPLLCKAQASYTELPGRWRWGVNAGAMWQTSNVKAIPALGGGFTIEKILNKRADALLGFSLGFRYLSGQTLGMNTTPSYGLHNNNALNGTFNPATNYDSMPGYFYYNHKTYIQEGNLELKMNFPKFEKNTGVILEVFGGIGISKYKTWIDALDANGNKYNFTDLQGKNVTQSDLNHVFDGSYETLAQGSSDGGTYRFTPSVGIGLGYHISRHFSLLAEYKVSFPGTNLLDGVQYDNNNNLLSKNDYYNYASLALTYTFYGVHHTNAQQHTNNTVYTNPTTTPVNTVVATNPNGYTNVVTQPAAYPPPSVIITYPANNFVSPYDYTTINANLTNIASAQQINISHNGYPIQYFTYNAYDGTLHFQSFLSPGANNFIITANNQGGVASQGVTVMFTPVNANPNIGGSVTTNGVPVTTATVTSVSNPTTTPNNPTTIPTATLNATHGHTVTSTNATTPTGTVAPTVTVNPNDVPTGGTIGVHGATVTPTGTVASTATVNAGGITPAGTFTVNGSTMGAGRKPVVSFVQPSVYPEQEPGDNYTVIATITNITNAGQVGVNVNGSNLSQFSFNPSGNIVTFVVTLQQGYNTVTVTGTNSSGSDTKSAVINHKPMGKPPKVTIFNPASNPFTTTQSNAIVSGYVFNVSSSADITVTANGAPTTFTYNASTHSIDVPVYLYANSTQVNISATNSYGNDSQGMEIIYKKMNENPTGDNSNGGNTSSTGMGMGAGVHRKPEITVTSPNVDPFYTNTGYISVAANVNFVFNTSDVSVSYNGAQVSFSYDMNSKHLNFSSPLRPGMNTFVINAMNTIGTTAQSININYTPISVNTSSGNNQAPTYNHGSWNIGGIFNSNNSGNAPVKTGGMNNNNINQNQNQNQNIPRGTPQINTNPNPGRPINQGNTTQPKQENSNGGGIRMRPR